MRANALKAFFSKYYLFSKPKKVQTNCAEALKKYESYERCPVAISEVIADQDDENKNYPFVPLVSYLREEARKRFNEFNFQDRMISCADIMKEGF